MFLVVRSFLEESFPFDYYENGSKFLYQVLCHNDLKVVGFFFIVNLVCAIC